MKRNAYDCPSRRLASVGTLVPGELRRNDCLEQTDCSFRTWVYTRTKGFTMRPTRDEFHPGHTDKRSPLTWPLAVHDYVSRPVRVCSRARGAIIVPPDVPT